MKLKEKESNVRSGGVQSKAEFKIKGSAFAFQMLSERLYSDKVGAVIRELCTNAYDSHVKAGKADVPFDVYFPNIDCPIFKVDDQGVSVPDDQIVDLLCTMFESDKRDSNSYVGAFGLGFKAFFAISDTAIITTYLDGVKRIYAAVMEAGIPTLNRMGETETDRVNGLCIEVPVKQEYIYDFQCKAEKHLKYFPVTPKVHGLFDFAIRKPSYIYEDSKTKITAKNSYQPSVTVVMGHVGYPVDVSQLDRDLRNDRRLEKVGIEIHANIGDVDIVPSREGLSYDESTVEYVEASIREALDKFSDTLSAELKTAKCPYEAYKLSQQFLNGISPELMGVKFKGKKIISDVRSWDIPNLKATSLSAETRWSRRNGDHVRINKYDTIYLYMSDYDQFYVDDTASGVKHYRKYVRNFYKVHGTLPPVTDVTILSSSEGDGWKILEKLGVTEDTLPVISSLEIVEVPKAPKAPKSPKGSTSTTSSYKPVSKLCVWGSSGWVDKDLDDLDQGGYYVPMHRGKLEYDLIVNTSHTYHGERDRDAKDVLRFLNRNGQTIWGVRRAVRKRFENHPKWVNVFDDPVSLCLPYVDLNKYQTTEDNVRGRVRGILSQIDSKAKAVAVVPDLEELYEYRTLDEDRESAVNIVKLFQRWDSSLKFDEGDAIDFDRIKELIKKFNVIRTLHPAYYSVWSSTNLDYYDTLKKLTA